MSSFFDAYMRERLAEYSEPLIEQVRNKSVTGARDLILQLAEENPLAANFIKSLFAGSPAQVVEAFAAWWPDVREVPNVEQFAAALQRVVLVEWNKPRPGILSPRRQP